MASDNDCDIAIDEGLDNDQDGFGCEPNSEKLQSEPAPTSRSGAHCGTTASNGTATTEMPRLGQALEEVCDYKDNNCNAEVDEGVRNEYVVTASQPATLPSSVAKAVFL